MSIFASNIYHLVTPRFNEGKVKRATPTSIIYSKHHIKCTKCDVMF
jgi:hypothetical protein